MEKSSKNLISLFGEKPDPSHPTPENLRSLQGEKARMQDVDAKSIHGIGTQREGEGGKITQNFTKQHLDARFYTKIAITFCAAEAIFCCPTENSHHLKS